MLVLGNRIFLLLVFSDLKKHITTERQSGLEVMNILYGRVIDVDEIVSIFATQHPRRILLRDI